MLNHIKIGGKMVLNDEKLDLEYVRNHRKMIEVKVGSCFYKMPSVIKSMSLILLITLLEQLAIAYCINLMLKILNY